MGRQTEFTAEMADTICERIADGESLRAICKDEGMPNKTTVFRWLAANKTFSDQYTRAREAQADSIFDEILDIADNSSNDWMATYDDENTGWRVNGDHVQRMRLRIDSRKWMAGKLRPKVYGDKVTVGGDTENPVSVVVSKVERTIVDTKG